MNRVLSQRIGCDLEESDLDEKAPDRPQAVLFDEDLCALLRISTRQLMRLRAARAFPIPELPSLDKRHRYARRDVDAFLARETPQAGRMISRVRR